MGDIGKEICLESLDARKLPDHRIEILEDNVKIIRPFFRMTRSQRDSKITVCYAAGCLSERLDRLLVQLLDLVIRQQREAQRRDEPQHDNRNNQRDRKIFRIDIMADHLHLHSRKDREDDKGRNENAHRELLRLDASVRPPVHDSTAL